jgi:ribonuclease HI
MKVKIELRYKTPRGLETKFISNEMSAEAAIIMAEDLMKTGRVKELSFIDNQSVDWTLKELKKLLEDILTEPHNITVYFDGGFDVHSKKTGLGCVIFYEKNNKSYRYRRNQLVEELETNNEAEYAALYLALQELEQLGAHHLPIKIIGDSQVVINQLNGEWPCYEEVLNRWIDRIEEKLEAIGLTPEYELVSRKGNKEADQLASQALKGIEIMSTSEIGDISLE